MEDDVVVEIADDSRDRRGFSLFRKEEENKVSNEPDMKVPFNNRFKHGRNEERNSLKAVKEETVEIENNLDKEAYDESAE